MAEVELKGVSKRFGSTEVVHGVDLSIRDNEFIVLVGPSGCGKSTILRMIAGLESVSRFRIVGKNAPKIGPFLGSVSMISATCQIPDPQNT